MSQKTLVPSELSEHSLKHIKEEFMEYTTIAELARKYNVKRSSLSYHIKTQGWEEERDLEKLKLFQEFTASKRTAFTKMSSNAIKIITRSLEALANRSEPPTTREAKTATEILESLDKITRLDDGKPTDISEERPSTVIEVQEKLKLDPFYQEPEEVDFEDITKVSN